MELEILEQYVKEKLGIPYVYFSGLDTLVAKEIVYALEIVIKRYPKLRHTICSIGDNYEINNQFKLVENYRKSQKNNKEDFVFENESVLSSVSIGTHVPIIKAGSVIQMKSFIALAYGDCLKSRSLDELNFEAQSNAIVGFHPKDCTDFKSKIFHEMGHILDFVLDITKDNKFYDLIEEKSNGFKNIASDISLYAMQANLSDILAETFAEYMINPSYNELISQIGKFVDEKYEKCLDSKALFLVNQRLSKRFSKVISNSNKNKFYK